MLDHMCAYNNILINGGISCCCLIPVKVCVMCINDRLATVLVHAGCVGVCVGWTGHKIVHTV